MNSKTPHSSQTSTPAAPLPTPGLALYAQVKEHIARRIQDCEWPPGHRLPSELELVAQFGVARMTVNRALRELVDQGKIVRVPGVGSFVAEEKPHSTLLQVASIASDIRGRGHEYGFSLITAEQMPAAPDVAAWLVIRVGENVFHCVCLHLENGLPVQLEDRYVNLRAVPAILRQDFSKITPSEYLVRHVPYDEIEHLVDAVLPTPEQAQKLAMDPSEPCLQLTRRTWKRGTVINYLRLLHPGLRYRLASRFSADGNYVA